MQQRFSNFCRALEQLDDFFEPPELNEREQQGLIKAFETSYELGWNTLRDLLRSQGNTELLDSKDTLREAFRLGLLSDGESALDRLHARHMPEPSHLQSPSSRGLITAIGDSCPPEQITHILMSCSWLSQPAKAILGSASKDGRREISINVSTHTMVQTCG